jgi:hypothetical protein
MAPVVIDAREVRVKARRIGQKSDRRDAFEVCDGLRRGIDTSIVYVPEEPIEKLRLAACAGLRSAWRCSSMRTIILGYVTAMSQAFGGERVTTLTLDGYLS